MVKLARAIVHAPSVIILGEPTSALAPPTRQRMIRLIREIRDSGEANILLSSHLLRDVEECCEEIIIMKQGEIVEQCDLAEERRANRKFLEIETRGDMSGFAQALAGLGCECAVMTDRRMKLGL